MFFVDGCIGVDECVYYVVIEGVGFDFGDEYFVGIVCLVVVE